MKQRAKIAGFATLAAAVGVGAYCVGVARADGVPATATLWYTGVIEDAAGQVVADGPRDITVSLHDAATAGSQLCSTRDTTTSVVSGRFRIELDPACVTAVHENPDVWVEVQVGTEVLGRSKVGAVPYALEADSAQEVPWAGVSEVTAATEWPGTVPYDRVTTPPTDLAALQNQVDALESAQHVYTNGSQSYSLDGDYCGSTTTAFRGDLGGYSGAKTMCEGLSSCDSQLAHVCTPAELVRFVSTGGSIPADGWMATGTFDYGGGVNPDDCAGFTSQANGNQGGVWRTGPQRPNASACDQTLPVLCCD